MLLTLKGTLEVLPRSPHSVLPSDIISSVSWRIFLGDYFMCRHLKCTWAWWAISLFESLLKSRVSWTDGRMQTGPFPENIRKPDSASCGAPYKVPHWWFWLVEWSTSFWELLLRWITYTNTAGYIRDHISKGNKKNSATLRHQRVERSLPWSEIKSSSELK